MHRKTGDRPSSFKAEKLNRVMVPGLVVCLRRWWRCGVCVRNRIPLLSINIPAQQGLEQFIPGWRWPSIARDINDRKPQCRHWEISIPAAVAVAFHPVLYDYVKVRQRMVYGHVTSYLIES